MDVKRALENMGLTKAEIETYLASLELGECTISDMAKAVHLPRSSCYNTLEHLIALGLINVLKVGSRKVYKAGDPEKLLVILRERENAIKEVVPRLKLRYGIHSRKPGLYFYDGKESIRAIFDDILEKQYPLYAITSINDALDVLGEDFRDFMEKRHKKQLRVKLLTSQSEEGRQLKKKDDLEFRQTKFLPSSFSFATANFIYGDRMAIISTKAKNPFGLIMEDPDIAQTYRDLFEIIWKQS
jgi:HTH-type transcriptional regulator, sugar sensing transcriptional regulator